MYDKIVNPETKRLVDINGRIGRKVLERYVSISKIGNTLHLEQTGGSYKEGDIMILYGGGWGGTADGRVYKYDHQERMSTIQVLTDPTLTKPNKQNFYLLSPQLKAQLAKERKYRNDVDMMRAVSAAKDAASMEKIKTDYLKVLESYESKVPTYVEDTLNLIDQNFQNLLDKNKHPFAREGDNGYVSGWKHGMGNILNHYNSSSSLFYENYHPVIIEVPKKGDHTLKEVLGPVSGGLKYKKLKVDNCVHTGIASEDKPKIRKIGTDEMKMLIDFIHNPKNEDIMKRNKALAFQTYRVWPRCVMKLNVPTVPYPSISMPSLPSSSDLVGSLSMLPSLM